MKFFLTIPIISSFLCFSCSKVDNQYKQNNSETQTLPAKEIQTEISNHNEKNKVNDSLILNEIKNDSESLKSDNNHNHSLDLNERTRILKTKKCLLAQNFTEKIQYKQAPQVDIQYLKSNLLITDTKLEFKKSVIHLNECFGFQFNMAEELDDILYFEVFKSNKETEEYNILFYISNRNIDNYYLDLSNLNLINIPKKSSNLFYSSNYQNTFFLGHSIKYSEHFKTTENPVFLIKNKENKTEFSLKFLLKDTFDKKICLSDNNLKQICFKL